MRSRILAATVGVLIIGGVCAACGSSDDSTIPTTHTVSAALGSNSPAGPQAQPPPAQPLDAQAVEPQDGVIEIAISGQSFQQNYLHVPLDESVTIHVTNKDGVQHSLRIAGLDGQFQTDDDALTNPAVIEGGGVGELTFAPQAAGAYTFRCDFHPATMGGEIVVGDATPLSAPASTGAATFPPGTTSQSPAS